MGFHRPVYLPVFRQMLQNLEFCIPHSRKYQNNYVFFPSFRVHGASFCCTGLTELLSSPGLIETVWATTHTSNKYYFLLTFGLQGSVGLMYLGRQSFLVFWFEMQTNYVTSRVWDSTFQQNLSVFRQIMQNVEFGIPHSRKCKTNTVSSTLGPKVPAFPGLREQVWATTQFLQVLQFQNRTNCVNSRVWDITFQEILPVFGQLM